MPCWWAEPPPQQHGVVCFFTTSILIAYDCAALKGAERQRAAEQGSVTRPAATATATDGPQHYSQVGPNTAPAAEGPNSPAGDPGVITGQQQGWHDISATEQHVLPQLCVL
jgi:hypothetical protein